MLYVGSSWLPSFDDRLRCSVGAVCRRKDIAIKKQNPIKRITQTQPTPITTSNKFEELEEMDFENKK